MTGINFRERDRERERERTWRESEGLRRGGVTMSKATTKREIDSINSKSAAKQHDLCSLRKYHSTVFTKKQGGDKFKKTFLPRFAPPDTKNMYRVKALGVRSL